MFTTGILDVSRHTFPRSSILLIKVLSCVLPGFMCVHVNIRRRTFNFEYLGEKKTLKTYFEKPRSFSLAGNPATFLYVNIFIL